MSKNFSYIAILISITIIFFTIILEDDTEISNAPTLVKEVKEVKEVSKKKKREIKISYENQQDVKSKLVAQNESTTKKEVNHSMHQEESKKVYELIDTGATVSGYEINIARDKPIPSRDSSVFPQIPASIQGKIDGKNFSLVIPSDLGVKDFQIKVKNQETDEIRFIPLLEEHLKAGSSSVLIIDTNNFENIELRSNDIQNLPLPPMPPLPAIPSN